MSLDDLKNIKSLSLSLIFTLINLYLKRHINLSTLIVFVNLLDRHGCQVIFDI